MNKLVTNYAFTVIYQILLMITPFVTTPYVSRILQPKGVGIDAYILSIVSLFLAFSMLGIPLYGSRQIAQMRDSKDLGKEFISIYIYQLTFSLISLIVYIIYVFSLNQNQVFYFIHIITFVAQAIDISWYFNGREENKKVAVRNIVVRIVSIILVFMLVKTTSDLWKYILINSVSLFVGQFIMWIHLLREIRFVKPQLENIMTHLKPIFVLFIPQINIQIYLLINRIVLGSRSGEIQV
ncbi:MAG: oligosaccharide flippase family protein, partial [Bacillus sp. (in: Bacteria)]|nr:oligosaccharide flippase family protein [Bacillus sp. (in: firmicutes)]